MSIYSEIFKAEYWEVRPRAEMIPELRAEYEALLKAGTPRAEILSILADKVMADLGAEAARQGKAARKERLEATKAKRRRNRERKRLHNARQSSSPAKAEVKVKIPPQSPQ